MVDYLTVIGGLVAGDHLEFDCAKSLVGFCQLVESLDEKPTTLEEAVSLGLDFFRDDPDTEAARVAATAAIVDSEDTCPGCGGPIEEEEFITQQDCDMALDLWVMVRDMVRLRDAGIEPEEC